MKIGLKLPEIPASPQKQRSPAKPDLAADDSQKPQNLSFQHQDLIENATPSPAVQCSVASKSTHCKVRHRRRDVSAGIVQDSNQPIFRQSLRANRQKNDESDALEEICSTAHSISTSLDQMMQSCDKLGSEAYSNDDVILRMMYEANYSDPIYVNARKAVAMAASEIHPRAQMHVDVDCNEHHEKASEVTAISRQVCEDMTRLQRERWAAGVLLSIPSEEAQDRLGDGPSKVDPNLEGKDVEESSASSQAKEVIDLSSSLQLDIEDHDRSFARVQEPQPRSESGRVESTLIGVQAHVETAESRNSSNEPHAPSLSKRISENSIPDSDMQRLQIAFKRFKVPDSGDLYKGDLCEALRYLGHVMTQGEVVNAIVEEITRYEYLDFDEFLRFMEKYLPYQQREFHRVFIDFDADGSGEIDVGELRKLLVALGFVPLRGMMSEALVAVDRDGNGVLNFDELIDFLRVYRQGEGFTQQEVAELRASFNRFSVQHAGGNARVLPADSMTDAMVMVFGLHVHDHASQLEAQLKSGQGLQKSSLSPTRGGRQELLQFSEFLIFARKIREASLDKLKTQYPDWASARIAAGRDSSAFSHHDLDGSGGISELELRNALKHLGFTPLRQNMQEVFSEVVDGVWHSKRELDFNEFFAFMLVVRQREGFKRSAVEEMRRVFERFDEDNSGEVNALELSDVFRHLGYKASLDDLHVFVKQVDANNSGQLDFREFLRLMRLHREDELARYTAVWDARQDSGRLPQSEVLHALAELGLKPTKMLRLMPKSLPPEGMDFDSFVVVVDSCREELVDNQRKFAGFSEDRIENFHNMFQRFDKDSSGDIDTAELIRILQHFNWEPKTAAEQAVLVNKLDVARARAREAGTKGVGADGSSQIEFWTFVQLCRILETEQEHAEEERLRRLLVELNFSQLEVDQFRQIFCDRKKMQNNCEGDDKLLSEEAAGLSCEGVRRLMRSLVSTIPPEDKAKLEHQLQTLMSGDDKKNDEETLDFHGFLRLMRWLLDTDFARINSRLANKFALV
mmetsp:Transcript_86552/g.224807  ORF Transcript_86552/g.224807 Transcript_86552/m.224807 type:complete len:1025 (+) Transcript_86552:3-3077(+)